MLDVAQFFFFFNAFLLGIFQLLLIFGARVLYFAQSRKGGSKLFLRFARLLVVKKRLSGCALVFLLRKRIAEAVYVNALFYLNRLFNLYNLVLVDYLCFFLFLTVAALGVGAKLGGVKGYIVCKIKLAFGYKLIQNSAGIFILAFFLKQIAFAFGSKGIIATFSAAGVVGRAVI